MRDGIRSLMRRPGVALTALLVLALGIGASVTIFSLISAALLRPLPYPQAERIVVPAGVDTERNEDRLTVAYPDVQDWKQEEGLFQDLSVVSFSTADLTTGGDPETVRGIYVDEGYFRIFQVKPVIGRLYQPEEYLPGDNQSVIISSGLWQTRFGGQEDVVGSIIEMSGYRVEVIGVVDPEDVWPTGLQYWLSNRVSDPPPPSLQERDNFNMRAIGRLAPGVTVPQARARLQAHAARIAQELPDQRGKYSATLYTLSDWIADPQLRTVLWILFGAVLFVLLIVCVNVANLLLARAADRTREMSVRMALGAGRARIIRQLLTESALLGLAGAGLGLIVALGGIDLFLAFPRNLGRVAEASLDWRVLLFAGFLGLATAAAFGLVPALQISRGRLAQALHSAGRQALTGGSRRTRSLLAAAQVALSLVLLIGAGLMIRSFAKVAASDPAIEVDNMLIVRLRLPSGRYPQKAQRDAFYREISQRLEQVPGIEGVSGASVIPFQGGGAYVFRAHLEEGAPMPPNGPEYLAMWSSVGEDYFSTVGLDLLGGRAFDSRDGAESVPVTVISKLLAERMFPGEDPLGKRIRSWRDEDVLRTVVGVVEDVKLQGRDRETYPVFYVPYRQVTWPGIQALFIRTQGEPLALTETVREQMWALDSKLPVNDIRPLREIAAESLETRAFISTLLAIFAGAAILLAAVGIYGVIAFLSAQRTQEIGVRMAMGACRQDILRLVMRQGVVLTVAGLVIGLGLSVALTRTAVSILAEVSPTDPLVYAAGIVLLGLIATGAVLVPALRASRTNPVRALRAE
ncbi:MAG TPA: ABC transporter permease [Acidobacteriota bacterium]|nr:ABC transporter permease [Acidobacteriota bacterium]